MTQVTAQLIKELRDRTGVGMAKCKEALVENNGDMEASIDYLRKKGIASAVKKESRDAKEGVIGSAESNEHIAIVEMSAETDFVTQNEVFQQFLSDLAGEIAANPPKDLEDLMQRPSTTQADMSVDEWRAVTIQKVGENIQVRRFLLLKKNPETSIGVYTHSNGKILAAVELTGSSEKSPLARDIAMHVAAAQPDYLNAEAIPGDIVEKEMAIARTQLESQGKPAHIMDKILEGKLKAFAQQCCLLEQVYVRGDKETVSEIVKAAGDNLAVTSFTRWAVGE